MKTNKALLKDSINVALQGETKEDVLTELVDMLVATGKLQERKMALKAIFEREKKMSTGMQNGIAIPHAKTDSIEHLVAAVGIKREGIDFGSLDGEPTRIFVLTLSPTKRAGPHLQFLAENSRSLNNPQLREGLLTSSNADEVLALLTNGNS